VSAPHPTLSIKGLGASPGVALGRAFLIDRKKLRTPKQRLPDADIQP
jgi:phosphotransferase system enzyme I (PtsI)